MCVLTTCVLVFDSYAGKHDRSGSCVIEHGRIDIKTLWGMPIGSRIWLLCDGAWKDPGLLEGARSVEA